MKAQKIICLLLVTILIALCLLGCRKNQQEHGTVDAIEETTEETEANEDEHKEPTPLTGLEDEDEEETLIIEIPEGTEIGGD